MEAKRALQFLARHWAIGFREGFLDFLNGKDCNNRAGRRREADADHQAVA
jgi:hypothetical protein